jgi:hypothetical protein
MVEVNPKLFRAPLLALLAAVTATPSSVLPAEFESAQSTMPTVALVAAAFVDSCFEFFVWLAD